MRSDDALGSDVWYLPAAHVVISLHTRSACPCGAVDVYWPLGHVLLCVAHWRLLEAVAALVWYSSLPHARAASQALSSLVAEKVVPTEQGAQLRSAVVVPSADLPKPMAHVRHKLHDAALPAALLN